MKIALYKECGLIGRTIGFFSRGNYSHTSIILNDGSVIDARPFQGVKKHQWLWQTIKKNSIVEVYEVETTPEQEAIIEDFLHQQLGKKYDWWSVFGFVLHTTRQGRKDYNKWFCSELNFAAFEKAGIKLLERVSAWKVSPTILSYSGKLKYLNSAK